MTGSEIETDGCRMETARGKGRKVGDCKRMWHREWELDYLVTYDTKTDTCICLKCNSTLDTVKKYTLQRHSEKMHPETNHWSQERRGLFVEQQKMKMRQMQGCLMEACVPSRLPKLAMYKLGFTLVHHHNALAFGKAIVEWAQSCEPDSVESSIYSIQGIIKKSEPST